MRHLIFGLLSLIAFTACEKRKEECNLSDVSPQIEKSGSQLQEISAEKFEKEVHDGIMIVNFYADWCDACHDLQLLIEEIAHESSIETLEGIPIYQINLSGAPQFGETYKIESVPTLIIFENGREVGRCIGRHSKTRLIETLNSQLKIASLRAQATSRQRVILSNQTKVDIKQLSESLGHLVAERLKTAEIDLDLQAVMKGIQASYNEQPSPLNEPEIYEALCAIRSAERDFKSLNNLHEANAFLLKNSKDHKTQIVIPGKLQFISHHLGQGSSCGPRDRVSVKISALLAGNKKISINQEAYTFSLNDVCEGLQLGISGMLPGEKRELFIHPDLSPSKEHLNELLTLEVELITINPKGTKSTPLPSVLLTGNSPTEPKSPSFIFAAP